MGRSDDIAYTYGDTVDANCDFEGKTTEKTFGVERGSQWRLSLRPVVLRVLLASTILAGVIINYA
jgi:hypothetical protein